jgi:CDP-glycerol glycerophosphotransferase (TagB/SpsB family)
MFFSFVCGILLSFIYKNQKSNYEIFFLGHKFDENLSQIAKIINASSKFEYQYCTIVLKDFIFAKSSNLNCLYLLSPITWVRLLNSKIVISLHGIYFHKIFNFFSKSKTIYLAHAFRTGTNENLNNMLYRFDEVWLSTNYEKEVYIKETNYIKNNIHVLGYPKYDSINAYKLDSINQKIKKIDDRKFFKIVTIAPTRNLKNKDLISNPFSVHNIEFLKKIDNLGKKLNILFIISLHPTAEDLPSNIKKFISNFKNIYSAKDLDLKNTFESLAFSDCLLTDYSTTFIDNLFFENELIILKTSIENRLDNSYKPLNVLNDFNYFECADFAEFELLLVTPRKNILKNELDEKYIGFQNDYTNSKRCFDRIKLLIEN